MRLPPNWEFRDLWGALFALFLAVLMFTRREGSFNAVDELLSTVSHMQTSHFLRKLLGLSPTSPKPRAMQGWGGVVMAWYRWMLHRRVLAKLLVCPYHRTRGTV